MGINEIVALLVAERDRIDRAIQALGAPVKRRGRPPKSAASPVAMEPVASVQPRKRKALSPAQRKAHSERMRAFWAARRKQKK
jgi:hypothetical protein